MRLFFYAYHGVFLNIKTEHVPQTQQIKPINTKKLLSKYSIVEISFLNICKYAAHGNTSDTKQLQNAPIKATTSAKYGIYTATKNTETDNTIRIANDLKYPKHDLTHKGLGRLQRAWNPILIVFLAFWGAGRVPQTPHPPIPQYPIPPYTPG